MIKTPTQPLTMLLFHEYKSRSNKMLNIKIHELVPFD